MIQSVNTGKEPSYINKIMDGFSEKIEKFYSEYDRKSCENGLCYVATMATLYTAAANIVNNVFVYSSSDHKKASDMYSGLSEASPEGAYIVLDYDYEIRGYPKPKPSSNYDSFLIGSRVDSEIKNLGRGFLFLSEEEQFAVRFRITEWIVLNQMFVKDAEKNLETHFEFVKQEIPSTRNHKKSNKKASKPLGILNNWDQFKANYLENKSEEIMLYFSPWLRAGDSIFRSAN